MPMRNWDSGSGTCGTGTAGLGQALQGHFVFFCDMNVEKNFLQVSLLDRSRRFFANQLDRRVASSRRTQI